LPISEERKGKYQQI